MSLFSSGFNPEKEKWDGARSVPCPSLDLPTSTTLAARTTFADAKAHFAFDESLPFHTLPRTLRSLLPAYDNIYVDIINPSSRKSSPRSILKYLSPSSEPRSEYDTIMESLNSSRRQPLAPVVAKLRSIKSLAEQAAMRAAADISGTAFAKVNPPSTSSTTQSDDSPHRRCDSPKLARRNMPSRHILNTYVQWLVHKDQLTCLSSLLGRQRPNLSVLSTNPVRQAPTL